ncbi:MAG: glycosyltransferase family 2 protein [Bacteroidia bacterium]|nr:glycosyltransferase family 2 protein [Bacteroidia bacterium]MDW8159224.1 glycosyltransferase family 2 protein [Bacteroidia bacterium]
MLELSIVIPLLDEEESLPELTAWIEEVMKTLPISYEILFIDDGSQDNSWQVIQNLRTQNSHIKAIRFQRNYGKSAALHVGFSHAQGNVIVTMDADLQDSPSEIPALYQMIKNQNYDLVSGYKKKRYDPLSKTLPSKFFNWVTRLITGIPLHDFNCGLKAYRQNVVKSIEVYGEMHRYIPFLAKAAGFTKIGEKIVEHRPRKYGRSKFGLERFINGFLDLLSITFLLRFGRKPMHFFGLLGVIFFLLGFLITTYLIAEKLYKLSQNFPPHQIRQVVEQPLFYIALVTLVIGVQLFLTGFLGELIIRHASDRNEYLIAEKLL